MSDKPWVKGLHEAMKSMVDNDYRSQRITFQKAQAVRDARVQERRAAYLSNPKLCKNCGKALTHHEAVKLRKDYCSRSYAASFNNKGRTRSLESRIKTAISVRVANGQELTDVLIQQTWKTVLADGVCEYCKKHYIKSAPKQRFCSKECSDANCRLPLHEKKENLTKSVVEFRRRLKERAVQYKGGKCQMCGYGRCMRALEFHHRDPSKKDFSIGANGTPRKWSVLKKELDKCTLLCANCHREEHDSMGV